MKTQLERSKSNRARCRSCAAAIAKDEPRVVEQIVGDNDQVTPGYHHVVCVAEFNRDRAIAVIASPETPTDLAEAALALIADAELVAQIRESRTRRKDLRSLDDDPQTQALIAELEAAPGNRGLLTVLADHLQQRGDDRGELITHDLAGSLEPAALARRRDLTASLAPTLETNERVGWGIGFIRKIEVGYGATATRLRALFAHPSCRLLEVISINRYDGRPAPVLARDLLPRTLRRIELFGDLAIGSDFSGLPHLQHVVIERATEASVDALEGVGRRIPHLAIRGYLDLRQHRSRLEAVCDQLELYDHTVEEPQVVVTRIEHANKPEWGTGTIVRELDDKIEVEFPNAGKKLFKRDAPFLRRI